jgi:hypothetical protein
MDVQGDRVSCPKAVTVTVSLCTNNTERHTEVQNDITGDCINQG